MSLASPATAPEILMRAPNVDVGHFVGTPRARCDEHSSKFPSVETEVIEQEGGRRRLKGVASNMETCTTQTQDFVPMNSEIAKLTGLLYQRINCMVWKVMMVCSK